MLRKLKTAYGQKLSFKFLAVTAVITAVLFSMLFLRLAAELEEHTMKQVRMQATILNQQIALTRNWVAEHGAVLVPEPWTEIEKQHPNAEILHDEQGRAYKKVSPSMLTRILSDRATRQGVYSFNITNTKRLNPNNPPDPIEREALALFHAGSREGVFRVDTQGDKTVMRYVAPVFVTDSCFACHAGGTLKAGDVGGCISVNIPMDEALAAIRTNRKILFGSIAAFSVCLIALVFLAARMVVFKRIGAIQTAVDRIRLEGDADAPNLKAGDELGSIAEFCSTVSERLKSRHENLERKIAEAVQDLSATNRSLESANSELERLNRAKSEFFSDISHELRTPLTGIKGAVDLLIRKSAQENKDYLHIIKRNAEHLIMIVLDFLDYSKMEAGRLDLDMREDSLDQVVADALLSQTGVALKKGVRLGQEGDREVKVVFDEQRIYQLLTNLLSNAVRFSPENGEVKIRIDAQSAEEVIVSVSDQGPGIDPKHHGEIFTKFYQIAGRETIHRGSSGIGLAICKGIAEAHGGVIEVQSEPDAGSVFSFRLPRNQSKGLPTAHDAASPKDIAC